MEKLAYILAERANKDVYSATDLIDDLDYELSNLEYGDVYEDRYQIWEYPSGKIYNITVSNTVPDKHYYSVPGLWEPKLVEVATDKQKVKDALERLEAATSSPSLLAKLLNRLRGGK